LADPTTKQPTTHQDHSQAGDRLPISHGLSLLDFANGQTHYNATGYILPQVGRESKHLSGVGKGWDTSTSLDQNNGREPAGPSHLLDL